MATAANGQSTSGGMVDWGEQSRQWDIRINLVPGVADQPGDLKSAQLELQAWIDKVKEWSAIKYIFIGGIELGDNPSREDFKRYHVHAALIIKTPTTRRSVVHNLSLSKYCRGQSLIARSYYLGKRNPFASFRGWREHHAKDRTKVTEHLVAYEDGEAPAEYQNQLIPKGKPDKMKQDDMLREIMQLFAQGKKDQAFLEYPALTLRYHAQITAFVKSRVELPDEIDHAQRLWIYGSPGTGKSAFVAYKFPKAYKKSLTKNEILYWNGLDLDFHTHVYLEDIGPEAFKSLGMEQLKQWADPSHGYTIAMKYGAPIQGVRLPLIVTSNYLPEELVPPDLPFRMQEIEAIVRRFRVVNITDLLMEHGLSLKTKAEIKELKKAKNADFGAVFNHTPKTPTLKRELVDLTCEEKEDELDKEFAPVQRGPKALDGIRNAFKRARTELMAIGDMGIDVNDAIDYFRELKRDEERDANL